MAMKEGDFMETEKYKVCRENIYAGSLVFTCEVYSKPLYHGEDVSKKVTTNIQKKCRTMLFVPDDKMFANDLLYSSPSYPILNMSNPEKYLDILKFDDYDRYYLNSNKGIFVIDQMCCLGPLLKFLGYDKNLSYEKILEIRKRLFNGTTSKDIQEYESMFNLIEKHFSKEYTELLRSLGTISLNDSLNNTFINKKNIFAPSRAEVYVKKLSRF